MILIEMRLKKDNQKFIEIKQKHSLFNLFIKNVLVL